MPMEPVKIKIDRLPYKLMPAMKLEYNNYSRYIIINNSLNRSEVVSRKNWAENYITTNYTLTRFRIRSRSRNC